MTRRVLGGRVLASLSPYCACGGEKRMALVSVQGMRAAGAVRCPHCDPSKPDEAIPIHIYRMRVDIPRDHEDDIA